VNAIGIVVRNGFHKKDETGKGVRFCADSIVPEAL
jgi:hypothetical protein